MTRLFLWIWGLAALAIACVYGLVMFATLRAAEDLFDQMTSLYDGIHELQRADPSDFPSVPREGYDVIGEVLSAYGFSFLGSMEDRTLSDVLPELRTYVDVYVDESGSVFCATYRIQSPQHDQQVVDFESRLEDGTFVATTNSVPSGWMTSAPEIDREIMVHVTIERLAERHSERLREQRARLLEVRTLEDVLETQRAFNAFEVRHRQSVGYLTYDELVAMSGQDAGTFYLPGSLRFLHWVFNRRIEKYRR